MKYFIKKSLKSEQEGPYTKDELANFLESYKIGIKTLCKPSNSDDSYFRPLNSVVPELTSGVNKEREELASSKNDTFDAILDQIILTTETYAADMEITDRLGVISSESALGMNIFRDLFANVRDLTGGKSVSTQKVLRSLKSNAFDDLKRQAHKLGADAVIGIDLDYSEFSGAGRSMLFLVVTGTAVKLSNRN